ncbi:MAG TPA: site-2 protease family protein [Casimicrobiaceae bacterium]|jgi:Zn-dependent protease|nr:site-2 protease family protein [Casimicrobiaceae bacterium]
MDFSLLETIALYAVPVVFAITLHEAAHGYVARLFGDSTAWMLGRVTANPLKHIDPVGTVLVPLGLLLLAKLAGSGGFLFGWAKPVPVNFGNLRNPKRDMLWVAAAGPGANLAMALLWAFAYRLGDEVLASEGLQMMARAGIMINVVLMVLNLLPILPLDGGRIAVSLLPHRLAMSYSRLEPYGFMVIILLLATGLLDNLMSPLIALALAGLQLVTGI